MLIFPREKATVCFYSQSQADLLKGFSAGENGAGDSVQITGTQPSKAGPGLTVSVMFLCSSLVSDVIR